MQDRNLNDTCIEQFVDAAAYKVAAGARMTSHGSFVHILNVERNIDIVLQTLVCNKNLA